jgi:hypothetical protein
MPLSAKCWNSPSLNLRVGNSRARILLHALLCIATIYCLYRISQRGYPLLSLLLVPLAGLAIWRHTRASMVGASVRWQSGRWTLERGGSLVEVVIQPRSTCLSWLVYLEWKEAPQGRRGSVCLFLDSAAPEQLRHLRVRLALHR